MVNAMVLGAWLLSTYWRKHSAFWESLLVIAVMIGIAYLRTQALPEIDSVAWVLGWVIRWLFVFLALWLIDALCTRLLSSIIFVIVASVAYFYLDTQYVGVWVEGLTKAWLG